MTTFPRHLRAILSTAVKDGCEVRWAGSGHLRVERDGRLLLVASGSPRDPDTAALRVAREYARARAG